MFKVRDLAVETVDGSAFDDFSDSSMLAIIKETGWLIGLFKVRDHAKETVDGSAFDDFKLLLCWQ